MGLDVTGMLDRKTPYYNQEGVETNPNSILHAALSYFTGGLAGNGQSANVDTGVGTPTPSIISNPGALMSQPDQSSTPDQGDPGDKSGTDSSSWNPNDAAKDIAATHFGKSGGSADNSSKGSMTGSQIINNAVSNPMGLRNGGLRNQVEQYALNKLSSLFGG